MNLTMRLLPPALAALLSVGWICAVAYWTTCEWEGSLRRSFVETTYHEDKQQREQWRLEHEIERTRDKILGTPQTQLPAIDQLFSPQEDAAENGYKRLLDRMADRLDREHKDWLKSIELELPELGTLVTEPVKRDELLAMATGLPLAVVSEQRDDVIRLARLVRLRDIKESSHIGLRGGYLERRLDWQLLTLALFPPVLALVFVAWRVFRICRRAADDRRRSSVKECGTD